MTSKLKTAVIVDDSQIVSNTPIDAAKHTIPLSDAETELRDGWVSVSPGDTHVKHLEDAVVGVSGKTKLTKQNALADESLAVDLDAAAVTSGFVPTANGAGEWSWAATGGGGASPVDVTVTAGETLAERDYVYLDESAGTWFKVDVDATPIKLGRIRGIVNEAGGITISTTGTVRILGEVSGYTGLTAWSPVYASSTAGAFTQTRPSPVSAGPQVAIVEIGVAVSTTSVLLMPPRPVQYMIRNDSLANDGTLLLQHHSDPMGHTREASAYVGSLDAGVSLTSYADSNQDAFASLQGGDGAGATVSITATGNSRVVGTNSGGNDVRNAQSFQITAGLFTSFDVLFNANTGSPTGTMTWELRADNAGAPTGALLATGTFTPVASSTNVVTVPVDQQFFLLASTTYWLVLFSTTKQATNVNWTVSGSSSSTYANGQRSLFIEGGSWTGQTDDLDMSFITSPLDFGQQLAQGFQFGTANDVEKVRVWLKKVGSPLGNLSAEIHPDSAGSPSGTPVTNGTSGTVAASTLATTFGYIDFTFSTPPSLSASTQYHLVLKTTASQSDTDFVIWGTDESTPSYASGELKSFNGVSWDAEGDDAVFDVISPGTTFRETAVIGRWSGGTRDVAVRFDDGGNPAADANIKTIGKNVTGVTADVTLVVEVP